MLMRKLACILLPLVTACNTKLADNISVVQKRSVSLVSPEGEIYCGGTLISNNRILTAAHCIDLNQNIFHYGTYVDFDRGTRRHIEDIHDARLIAHDSSLDLAMLEGKDLHFYYAQISNDQVNTGDVLQFVGNVNLYPFSFNRGYVSSVRTEINNAYVPTGIHIEGRLRIIQMSIPIMQGCSGSGVYNEHFQLIGVVSWHSILTQASVAIHRDEIVKFIEESEKM